MDGAVTRDCRLVLLAFRGRVRWLVFRFAKLENRNSSQISEVVCPPQPQIPKSEFRVSDFGFLWGTTMGRRLSHWHWYSLRLYQGQDQDKLTSGCEAS